MIYVTDRWGNPILERISPQDPTFARMTAAEADDFMAKTERLATMLTDETSFVATMGGRIGILIDQEYPTLASDDDEAEVLARWPLDATEEAVRTKLVDAIELTSGRLPTATFAVADSGSGDTCMNRVELRVFIPAEHATEETVAKAVGLTYETERLAFERP